jgi:polyhydroxybutyrate depolymerase
MMRRFALLVVLLLVLGACADAPPGAIDETRTITLGSSGREYRLVVPAEREDPVPLVLVFHGFAGEWSQVRDLSGFTELAESEGFAVAFPQAAGLIPAWRTELALSAPDVAFVRALVDDVASVIEIDPDRVYAAGMSNGGGMAGRVGCEASDVFAAVGVVAAAHGLGACVQDRPVPVIAFHGDADRIVPLDGFPFIAQPIVDWMSNRARGNGCDEESGETEVAADVTLIAWTGCDADVHYYLVADGRHGWPGSDRAARAGDSTSSIDATGLMWEFFSERPKP